jgi:hypothetical protein
MARPADATLSPAATALALALMPIDPSAAAVAWGARMPADPTITATAPTITAAVLRTLAMLKTFFQGVYKA